MANHKRKRPKNRRAGCLMCKPWKANGVNEDKASVKRQVDKEADRQDEDDFREGKEFYPEIGVGGIIWDIWDD